MKKKAKTMQMSNDTMNSIRSIAQKNIELIDLEKEKTTSLENMGHTGSIDMKDEKTPVSSPTCRALSRGISPNGILLQPGMNFTLKSYNAESRE